MKLRVLPSYPGYTLRSHELEKLRATDRGWELENPKGNTFLVAHKGLKKLIETHPEFDHYRKHLPPEVVATPEVTIPEVVPVEATPEVGPVVELSPVTPEVEVPPTVPVVETPKSSKKKPKLTKSKGSDNEVSQ